MVAEAGSLARERYLNCLRRLCAVETHRVRVLQVVSRLVKDRVGIGAVLGNLDVRLDGEAQTLHELNLA